MPNQNQITNKGTNSAGNNYKSYSDGSYCYNNGNGKTSSIEKTSKL